ncbi:MAG: DUF4058 family protein [Xenococcaceae cyanobacterium]
MPSPFPGMDPYLEAPPFWSAFHNRLIVTIADDIAPSLRPQYYVEIETRIYRSVADEGLLVGIPDAVVFSSQATTQRNNQSSQSAATLVTSPSPKRVVLPIPEEVKERYLEVREVETDAVITVIEVLSPKNKQAGPGRTTYEAKRQAILGSFTHLVEIDLLRRGRSMSMSGEALDTDYHILISRAEQRPYADFYGFSLRDSIPSFVLPLRPGDREPIVAMQSILDGVYDRAGYDLRIDYQQAPPSPTLSESDRHWLAERVKR